MSESNKQLIPAIVQDYQTGEVLMLAYMNDESLKKTIETGTTWFWSRSRQKYWNKGETSGNKQIVKELRYDCDEDTYLVLVEQVGGIACHTGNRSCFYRSYYTSEDYDQRPFSPKDTDESIFSELAAVIADRRDNMPEGSYTTHLFNSGLDKMAKKINEEAGELIEAAREKNNKEIVWEASDLIYHIFTLLTYKDIKLAEVEAELRRRRTDD